MLVLQHFLTKGACMYQPYKKIPKTYEHIDPAEVGNSRNIVVSDQAGKSNILIQIEDDRN